eukprot:2897138-Prymnesium_polylepis.1
MLSTKALKYSDDSPLERHHLEATFSLLHEPMFNFLSSALSRDEYREFRRMVIAIVLATDLKKHFESISRLKSLCPGALTIKSSDSLSNASSNQSHGGQLPCSERGHSHGHHHRSARGHASSRDALQPISEDQKQHGHSCHGEKKKPGHCHGETKEHHHSHREKHGHCHGEK